MPVSARHTAAIQIAVPSLSIATFRKAGGTNDCDLHAGLLTLPQGLAGRFGRDSQERRVDRFGKRYKIGIARCIVRDVNAAAYTIDPAGKSAGHHVSDNLPTPLDRVFRYADHDNLIGD